MSEITPEQRACREHAERLGFDGGRYFSCLHTKTTYAVWCFNGRIIPGSEESSKERADRIAAELNRAEGWE